MLKIEKIEFFEKKTFIVNPKQDRCWHNPDAKMKCIGCKTEHLKVDEKSHRESCLLYVKLQNSKLTSENTKLSDENTQMKKELTELREVKHIFIKPRQIWTRALFSRPSIYTYPTVIEISRSIQKMTLIFQRLLLTEHINLKAKTIFEGQLSLILNFKIKRTTPLNKLMTPFLQVGQYFAPQIRQ